MTAPAFDVIIGPGHLVDDDAARRRYFGEDLVEDGPRSEVWGPTTAAQVNFPAVLAPQKFRKFRKFGKFD